MPISSFQHCYCGQPSPLVLKDMEVIYVNKRIGVQNVLLYLCEKHKESHIFFTKEVQEQISYLLREAYIHGWKEVSYEFPLLLQKGG